ncbi:SdpI family protein [Bittarella massiliensis (ex Durand et al. 2017)]|uniref:SdpI family protein n=1 Tax=Bittarella massiliensis (ex Durand et al. 2017) TaxID=1720313 RepID=UPI001AA127D8|nr:SdpI family protein [Bittarella massiliensis (ex Durand et al. 2017)]MBO1680494.1 SdpI family protein [Bittarella massiliensis (ex Durand et al. 2017)]
MKGRDRRLWLLIGLMLAAALCCLPFLPAVIPAQWNDSGVSGRASRLLLLVFPALAAGFHLLRRAQLVPGNPGGIGPSWGAALLLFGAQLFLTGNGLGLWTIGRADSRLLLPLANMIVGALLLWWGNSLPKSREESGRGIKAPAALLDRENWRRTQRFGGRVWFACGLAALLAALLPVPWNGAILLAAILTAVLLPRLYSSLIFKNK